MANQLEQFRNTLVNKADDYDVRIGQAAVAQLSNFYALLLTWNPRLHLVAPCSPAEFATRHVLESLLLSSQLGSEESVVDVGTGAGLPMIPNLIVRADIRAVLIESSQKKAVFLREALRLTGTSDRGEIVPQRFQDLAPPDVGVVTCRALDNFSEVFPDLIQWSPRRAKLMFFGGEGLRMQIEGSGLEFKEIKIPNSERRFLFVIER
jgi:16S rRNA (guanine527-N7)-methyltransferase